MIGTTVDHYRILSRIGGGGMGDVFKALDLELEREVAIKCVRPELADLEEATARFRNEARTLAKLSHGNIATVYRFFRDQDRLFLVMEYIDGEPFGARLRRCGAMPANEAVWMVREALHGLGYAHRNGVVHRDIKPGNLMLSRDQDVKVLDFGIAHLVGGTRLTRAGGVVGTPAYMAPEQILGKDLDPRTDLYSIGIVLYEMLSGTLPYEGNSDFEIMRSHIEETPRPISALAGSEVPEPLQAALLKALSKDREGRFQTAEAFDEALLAALPDATDDTVKRTLVLPPGSAGAAAAGSPSGSASGSAAPPTPLGELLEPVATELRNRLRPLQILVGVVLALMIAGIAYVAVSPGGTDSAGPAISERGAAPSLGPGAFGGAVPPAAAAGDQAERIPPPGESRDTESTPGGTDAPGVEVAGLPLVGGQPSFGGQRPFVEQTSPSSGVTAVPEAERVQQRPAAGQTPEVVRKSEPSARPAARPAQTAARTSAVVRAVKVSVHERQGQGRFSRNAGYNGAFSLSGLSGSQTTLEIQEVADIYADGQLVRSTPIITEVRRRGSFKSKQRIPELKTLDPGRYEIQLRFVAQGRTIGTHSWTVEVEP